MKTQQQDLLSVVAIVSGLCNAFDTYIASTPTPQTAQEARNRLRTYREALGVLQNRLVEALKK